MEKKIKEFIKTTNGYEAVLYEDGTIYERTLTNSKGGYGQEWTEWKLKIINLPE